MQKAHGVEYFADGISKIASIKPRSNNLCPPKQNLLRDECKAGGVVITAGAIMTPKLLMVFAVSDLHSALF